MKPGSFLWWRQRANVEGAVERTVWRARALTMLRQPRSFVRTVLAIVLATVMLGACDWAQIGFGPGGTNFNPSEPTLTPSTVSGLHERWSFETIFRVSWQPPLTANGLVYLVVPGNRVAAVSATTGAPIWSVAIDVTSVFAVADGRVYAATEQGLSAFDALTGAEIWSITIRRAHQPDPESQGEAVVANGLVYFVGLDSRLYAFDAATGTLGWSVAPTSRTLGPGVVVANGVAYVAASDGAAGPNVFALNAVTGATIWSATADLFGEQAVAFVSMAAGGKAYVVSAKCSDYVCGIQTQAFDATDGSVDWEADGGVPLAVGDGIMYRSSDTLDSATGEQLWSHSDSPHAVAIAHGVIYASNGFRLRALDAATGTELWSSPDRPFATLGGPSVANGALYVASGNSLVAYGL
jgi:outer membrane protein assembly factor BamB